MTDVTEAPAWLVTMLTQQSNQIAALAEQQANQLATLSARIESVAERQDTPNTTPLPPPPPSVTTDRPQASKLPKQRLPQVDKYDGTDKALYPQFEGQLKAKLSIDGLAIGGEAEQVWYGFSRLKDGAAGRIYPWMVYAQTTGQFTLDMLFRQMSEAFRDPHSQQKALTQLNKVKQKSTPLDEFLNSFNRLLLEAEGWGWQDNIKKGYLKAALSTKLLGSMVGTKEEETYEGYCTQLRVTTDQMNELAERNAGFHKTWKKENQSVIRPVDQMDWAPAPTVLVTNVQPRKREPRWAPPEELERRRREGLCLRCADSSHRARQCKAKLVWEERKIQVAVATRNPDSEVRVQETTSDSENESGKE